MTTLRTHFTFRVDTWTPDGESTRVIEDSRRLRVVVESVRAPLA
jgi:hypothetical protein